MKIKNTLLFAALMTTLVLTSCKKEDVGPKEGEVVMSPAETGDITSVIYKGITYEARLDENGFLVESDLSPEVKEAFKNGSRLEVPGEKSVYLFDSSDGYRTFVNQKFTKVKETQTKNSAIQLSVYDFIFKGLMFVHPGDFARTSLIKDNSQNRISSIQITNPTSDFYVAEFYTGTNFTGQALGIAALPTSNLSVSFGTPSLFVMNNSVNSYRGYCVTI
ncbi:MAG: hypothetical protein AB8B56_04900 [Crocinitomicaceae bacterium]